MEKVSQLVARKGLRTPEQAESLASRLPYCDEGATMDAEGRLRGEVARHPYPLVFATVSGAHLYGFPSPDSDYDLRGCHVLPAREVVGLDAGRETVESATAE